MEFGKHRPRPRLPAGAPRRRALAADLALEGIQLPDAPDGLGGKRRAVGHVDVVELAPHVRPAGRLHDPAILVERTEAGIAVGLQDATEGGQMRARMLALAVGRVAIPHRRRRAAAGRAVIAHVGPQAARLGAAAPRIEHRHRGVVGVNLVAANHVAANGSRQGCEQPCGLAHPIGERGPLELNAGTPVDALLAIQRAVVGVLGDHHLGE